MLRTHWDKIKLDFELKITLPEPSSETRIKKEIAHIVKDFKSLTTTGLKWDSEMGDLTFQEAGRDFVLEILLSRMYERMDAEPVIENLPIDAVGITLKTKFIFGELEKTLLTMSTVVGRLTREFILVDPRIKFSKGAFTVSPKRTLVLEDWIRREQLKMTLLLQEAEYRMNIEFYKDNAKVLAPDLGFTEKTARYLHEILILYYI